MCTNSIQPAFSNQLSCLINFYQLTSTKSCLTDDINWPNGVPMRGWRGNPVSRVFVQASNCLITESSEQRSCLPYFLQKQWRTRCHSSLCAENDNLPCTKMATNGNKWILKASSALCNYRQYPTLTKTKDHRYLS